MKKILGFAIFLIAAFCLTSVDATAIGLTLAIAPQAVQADYYNNIVTSFDLNIIKWFSKLYPRYGKQGFDVLDTLQALGFERTDSVEIIRHFEENWVVQAFKNKSAQAAGAAGALTNITLSPDSVDTSNRFYPRITDIITFPDETQGYIYSIDVSTPSAPVLGVVPLGASPAVVPALTAGEVLFISSNAFSEGSTQPVGRFSGAWEYTNNMQIIKESMGVSGTQLTNETWVKTLDGKNIDGWWNKGLMDIQNRMKGLIQGAWLTQTITTNPLVMDSLNNNGAVKTTEGLYPGLKRLGIPYPYTPGTLTVYDFNTIERLMSRQGDDRYIMDMMGQDADMEMEDVLQEYHKFTAINNTTKVANTKLFGDGPGGEAMSSVISYQYFEKGQRVHCMKRFAALNNPQTFGAEGYKYPGKVTFIPLNKNNKDPQSKNSVPSIGIVWKGMGDRQRKLSAWDYGAAEGGPKMGAQDRRDWYLRCEMSAEFFGLNQFVDMFVQ